jgi:ATP-dependent Clp protease ATP-binding subunit ClpA
MYERFTDRARRAMQLANQEAIRFNHEYIGTEHILLGLVKEGSGIAANVLKNLDVDLRRVRLEVEKLLSVGPGSAAAGKWPPMPWAKKVIEHAMAEARDLGHNYVGTEHILLGLLREDEGVAAQVLMNLGLRLDEVRQEVLAILRHGTEVSAPPAPPDHLKPPAPEDARSVLRTAEAAAQQSGHSAVCTAYVLLGLVRQSGSLASRVLCHRGVSEQFVIEEVRSACPESPPPPPGSVALPLSLWTHDVLRAALDEARALSPHRELEDQIRHLDEEKEEAVAAADFDKAARLRDRADELKKALPKTSWTVGPEHLLLALLRAAGSEGLRIVQAAGVNPETLRAAVLRELGGSGSPDQTEEKP